MKKVKKMTDEELVAYIGECLPGYSADDELAELAQRLESARDRIAELEANDGNERC